MAEIVPNEKGFKVLRLSVPEAKSLGWGISEGIVCDHCNEIINGDVYFPAVLNDTFCEKCFKEWLSYAENFPEDAKFETSCFNYYCKLLNINKE
jgi:hypothetical protein